MSTPYVEIAVRLIAALAAGALIGLERSYHGRPAGFRTHSLVALSTALLMVVPMFGDEWFPAATHQQQLTLDPTRMAQGIMTGIGFLGAGAILRDGLSIRGLTTAASIWITAAIGILMGIGFYLPGALATTLTLGTLTVFRRLEDLVPSRFEAQLMIRFRTNAVMPEAELRELILRHGFTSSNPNYHLDAEQGFFEYRTAIKARSARKVAPLNETLRGLPGVREYTIAAVE